MPRQPCRVESADFEEIADQVGSSSPFHLGRHLEKGIGRVVIGAATLEKGHARCYFCMHVALNQS